ncbi:hypothetical protein [Flavobacterium sp. SM2513]|uniref:hypothetical protein n=1 Tax=Flavobacterium sp. SM2513 TaxID=3424766 RepID=UPI003D7FB4E0
MLHDAGVAFCLKKRLLYPAGVLLHFVGVLLCFAGTLLRFAGNLLRRGGALLRLGGAFLRHVGTLLCFEGALLRFTGVLPCFVGELILQKRLQKTAFSVINCSKFKIGINRTASNRCTKWSSVVPKGFRNVF